LLPDATLLRLEAWSVDDTTAQITLAVQSTQPSAPCPLCATPARRIHSDYERTLADLPWGSYRVCLQLRVRKWFCRNRSCHRRIFTERLPTVAVPWARRTLRLAQRLVALGVARAPPGGPTHGGGDPAASPAPQLVRQLQPAQLDPWLRRATNSTLDALRRFAKGLYEDDQAVKAGVTLPWSTGPVEGHINRLKILKRQMFGSARLDLLGHRFLRAPRERQARATCPREPAQAHPEAAAA
jgi:transposase